MLIVIFILILIFMAWLFFTPVKLFFKHPYATIKNAIIDVYKYFKYKEYNRCKTGKLVGYIGLFGKGKTLSAVHDVVELYNTYNNKPVWSSEKKMFVTQKINVYSNVNLLTIPYIPFTSLQQVLDVADYNKKVDEENDTLTCSIFLGDEFSVQMNSRSFKTNIDPLFLNTLLTCRHHHISLYYTAQRFGHVDALLRQVTSYVVDCNKVWRFMCHQYFDAWEMENAQSVGLLMPFEKSGFFVFNKDYNNYNTLATVDNLSKSVKENDMLSVSEILQNQQSQFINIDAVSNPSKSYIKTRKKMNK